MRGDKALAAEQARANATPRASDKKLAQGRGTGGEAAPGRGGKARHPAAPTKKKRKTALKKSVLRARAHRWYLLHPGLQPVPLQIHPAMAGYVGVVLAQTSAREASEEEKAQVQGDSLGSWPSALCGSAAARDSGGVQVADEVQSQEEGEGSARQAGKDPNADADPGSEEAGEPSGLEQAGELSGSDSDSEASSGSGSGSGSESESESAPDAPFVRELVSAVGDEHNWDPRLLSPVFWGCSVAPEGAVGGVPLVGATGAPTAGPKSVRFRLHNARPVREYVSQALSSELDAAVCAMLSRLMQLQERLRLKDAAKSKMRRRLVFGLREVLRGVRSRRCKCVVVAPNLEQGAAGLAHTGLDATIRELLLRCAPTPDEREQGLDGVPVVFALSAVKLGRALGKTVKVSAVGLYSADGAFPEYKDVLRRTARLSAFWERAVAREMLAAPPQRALLALCAECHAFCGMVRHDCEACGVTRCARCAASALARRLPCPKSAHQPPAPCAVLRVARGVPAEDELRARQRSDELLQAKLQAKLLKVHGRPTMQGKPTLQGKPVREPASEQASEQESEQTGDQTVEQTGEQSRLPEGQGEGLTRAKQGAGEDEEREQPENATAAGTLAEQAAAPSTLAPSTLAPSTLALSTLALSTLAPSTLAPSTLAPGTLAPSTLALSTLAPSTLAPSTLAPSTPAPSTLAPSTLAPCKPASKPLNPAAPVYQFRR